MINIVLVEPLIPQNTGNIMRSCVATNAKLHLIKPLGFSLDEASIKRSGVNYLDKLNYEVYEDIDSFFKTNKGVFYYLTRYAHKPHSDFNYKDLNTNYYFVFGKETTGLDKSLLKDNIKTCIRIPTSDKVRSLNLSNAVAVILYEVLRQQNYPDLCMDEPHKTKFEIENA